MKQKMHWLCIVHILIVATYSQLNGNVDQLAKSLKNISEKPKKQPEISEWAIEATKYQRQAYKEVTWLDAWKDIGSRFFLGNRKE